MDILDRIRNTSVADLERVSGDFSDLPTPVYAPSRPKEMQRIVKGATDLRDAYADRPAPQNPGMVTAEDWSGQGGQVINRSNREGMPTIAQATLMSSLIGELLDLDSNLWEQATDYTRKMNEARAWDRTYKTGNVSRWITNLRNKIAELKVAVPAVTCQNMAPTSGEFDGVPDGRYAVCDPSDGKIKFYRVNTGRNGRQYLDVQASDELHPIRNATSRMTILDLIRKDGIVEAMAAYGRLIGRCGRCNRTLTDATSRAAGIGPDCREKM